MKLVMTLLVRDAENILRENLDFHLGQGVDFFIITDNLSTDRTAEIAGDYVRRGLAELLFESRDDYSQSRWVTRMARRAATEHGADWVVNNDDDEFWSGATTLRDELAATPEACEALVVERRNHPPVPGVAGSGFLSSMIYRERQSFNALGHPLPAKVCHRAFPDVDVAQGNHAASRGEVALRSLPTSTIVISHFPIRDYATFERKIVNGGSAYARNTEFGPNVGMTWRQLHALWREGGLPGWYEQQVLGPEKISSGLADGSLAIDESVLHALRHARAR